MTSRQAGRRMATISAQRKRQTGRSGIRQPGRRKDESMRPKERRQFLQLVICCGIFVLLVAAKLLLPDQMKQWNQTLSGVMEQNMDVQAVFSAVGRAVSGESDVNGTLEDVYEPYLLMNGLLNRTPRGRMATEAAYRHLGYAWNQEKNGISEI